MEIRAWVVAVRRLLAVASMTESHKAQWQCATTTRLECHVRGTARSFLTGIRAASLIPAGKTTLEKKKEKARKREREGGKKRKRDESPRVHESQMAFAPLLQVIPFIVYEYREPR